MKNKMYENYWGEPSDQTKNFHIRSKYEGNPRLLTPIREQTKTLQSAKDECDINKIVPRALKNGTLGELLANGGWVDQDFSSPVEYQEACNLVIEAQAKFDSLPSKLRDRFKNEPSEFLRFVSDPSNEEEMVTLGLATRRPTEPSPEPLKQKSGDSPDKTPKAKPEE